VDVFAGHLKDTIKAAAAHKGTAFVEVFQNCNIFNDGAFRDVTEKDVKDDSIIELRANQPLLYGKNLNKGLRFNGFSLESVDIGDRYQPADCITWDPHLASPALAFTLATGGHQGLPTPIGIFRQVQTHTFDEIIHAQINDAREKRGPGSLEKLIYSGDIWDVKKA
jgi:2-oxoglutarate ferredoxin oxidoreductase subunit beta